MGIIHRLQSVDEHYCRRIYRCSTNRIFTRFMVLISRLGNGVFWYSLICALPFIYGMEAFKVSITMTVTGLIGLAIYKYLKRKTTRRRPFVTNSEIIHGTAPLDEFSFPSGHTLHAFCFGLIAIAYYPELAYIVLPMMLLIALSRVSLGLHYPSDVVVGALIGSSLASAAVYLV